MARSQPNWETPTAFGVVDNTSEAAGGNLNQTMKIPPLQREWHDPDDDSGAEDRAKRAEQFQEHCERLHDEMRDREWEKQYEPEGSEE